MAVVPGPMLARRHRLQVRDLVVVLHAIDVMHDDFWPQVQRPVDFSQVMTAGISLAEMPFQEQPVLADLVEWRERMILDRPHDVAALVGIAATSPARRLLAEHRVQGALPGIAEFLPGLR